MSNWYDKVDTRELYADKVVGCDECGESPLNIKGDGVVCGPILRLISVDYEKNLYRGSMLVVTKGEVPQPKVDIQLGPSMESSGSVSELNLKSGQLNATLIHSEMSYKFYRYAIEIELASVEQMCKYSVDGNTEAHYRFFIPSNTTNFNTISVSCNGFSLSVDTTKFKGSMWYDILRKHADVHYHVMLGGGDQIYSDSIKLYCNRFQDWLKTKDPIKKYSTKCSPELREELDKFYLKEYLEWFGYGYWKGSTEKSNTSQRCFPIAMSTIPSVNVFDDHDIIDGYGSYSHKFMSTDVFKNVGKSAYKYYMLFQHHTSVDEVEAYHKESCWVLGAQKGDYIEEKSHSVYTRLGPSMAVLGIDCRTERKLTQICSKETYDILFKKLADEVKHGKIDHLLLMLGVPIAYPRLVWLEYIFSSKFLFLFKWLSKKGIIAKGLVNEFNGDVELLDDLNDHWCAHYHKKERNYLLARLQDFAAQNKIRVTILSGDVHLASVGRFRSKVHTHHITSAKEDHDKKVLNEPENDVRLMVNVISSAVVNTPPPDQMAMLLQKRNKNHHFDRETDEDAVPIFMTDVNGENRSSNAFMNRRNWSDIIPVTNIINNKYLKNEYKVEIGEKLVPGTVGIKQEIDDSTDVSQVAYPVTENGIIATIHVEKDTSSPKSETVGYQIAIPELQTQISELSHAGIKHLDLK
ncbi:unnamed protein product [Kluyveromyces dobzhanskii CBS 2104]|uniref:WGS project CCBQ000000000 data, contig 00107 n=1 Tax=Kluyveromyces dobzhanskii CBS 2104 TaxID=1427455 RepID=A0A0A8L112_9SACH|nr:unnamed protein product [Kluyveromyces dobzhanskii CBS 2104]